MLAQVVVRLTVRVHPRSNRGRLLWDGRTLQVWVTSPPVDGAANVAVLAAIAEWLEVPRSAVRLVTGQRSRTKLVEVDGLTTLPSAGQIPT